MPRNRTKQAANVDGRAKGKTQYESGVIPKPLSVGEETFALHLQSYGFKAEREFKFCEGRKWRFDFAFPERMVAIEIEGATWSSGRHSRGSGYEKDLEKYNAATRLGWRLFRYTTGMVTRGDAIRDILSTIFLDEL